MVEKDSGEEESYMDTYSLTYQATTSHRRQNQVRLKPTSVRFSQDSIAGNFKNGGSVQDLAAQLKAGKVDPSTIPTIHIVVKDGKFFTLDNRRLKAFQEAGIDIPYTKLDSIPRGERFKFRTKDEGVDIRVRGGSQ